MFDIIDKFEDEYRFLSNFDTHPFTFKDRLFKSVEHAYQAYKATNRTDFELVANASTPGRAKRAGRTIECRPDWEDIKVDIMLQLVRAKFISNPHLTDKLLDTGDRELIEGNTWGDTFWGVCNNKGHNMLGIILMKVREELRNSMERV